MMLFSTVKSNELFATSQTTRIGLAQKTIRFLRGSRYSEIGFRVFFPRTIRPNNAFLAPTHSSK